MCVSQDDMRMKAIANVAFDFCAVSFLGKGALHLVKAYGSEALRRLEADSFDSSAPCAF